MFLYYDEPERGDQPRDPVLRPLLRSAARYAAFYTVLAALIVISDHVPMTVPLVYLNQMAG